MKRIINFEFKPPRPWIELNRNAKLYNFLLYPDKMNWMTISYFGRPFHYLNEKHTGNFHVIRLTLGGSETFYWV